MTTASIVHLRLDDQTHELEVAPGETIFAAARRAGLRLPFSCVSGYCGECLATLEDGEVKMRVNMALTAKQLARGLILTCQAIPSTRTCLVRFGE